VGNRLMLSGTYQGKPVWVVDSPNYGHAAYVFDKEDAARDFADGKLRAKDAQGCALRRVVHVGEWAKRTREAFLTSVRGE
jgi:hypothetical protein